MIIIIELGSDKFIIIEEGEQMLGVGKKVRKKTEMLTDFRLYYEQL